MFRRILRAFKRRPRTLADRLSDMTLPELTAWAAQHGKVLVSPAELDALCAAAAFNVDHEYEAICHE